MNWDHRVLVHEYKGNVSFSIRQVVYLDGKPRWYKKGVPIIGSGSLEDIQWHLDSVQEALSKPILYAGERFPEEYNK